MKNIKVLIVEDELISAELLKNILTQERYEIVDICTKGSEAITVAKEKQPDIIFMDVMLEDNVTGSEAALEISRLQNPPKIIFMTAYSDVEILNSALEAGAVNYLIKPCSEQQVIAALKLLNFQKNTFIPSQNIHLKHGFTYNFQTKSFYKDEQLVALGKKPTKLIEILCKNCNNIVTQEQLHKYIYAKTTFVDTTLRTLIFRTNQAVGLKLIKSVSNRGYMIECAK